MIILSRILIFSSSKELLFDVDYANVYCSAEISQIRHILKEYVSPITKIAQHSKWCVVEQKDDVFIVLVTEKMDQMCAVEKAELLQMLRVYSHLCFSFLGHLTMDSVLCNLNRLAELTGLVFMNGRLHFTSADKIKGFINSPYIDHSEHKPAAYKEWSHSSLSRPMHGGHRPAVKDIVVSSSKAGTGAVQKQQWNFYIDLIETVTRYQQMQQSGNEYTEKIAGVCSVNNNTPFNLRIVFQLKNSDDVVKKVESSYNIERDNNWIAIKDIPIGQSDILTYTLNKHRFELFTLKAAKQQMESENMSLKIELACNSPYGSVAVKTLLTVKLSSAFCKTRGRVSILHKLPAHSMQLKQPSVDNTDKSESTSFDLADKSLDGFTEGAELVWNIPEMHGQTSANIVLQFLDSRTKHEKSDIVQLDVINANLRFELSKHLFSGVTLSGMKISPANNVHKYIRHLTISSLYNLSSHITNS